MARLFFLALLASGSLASVVKPWIGVVIAYGFAILAPQLIWYWAFSDVRPVLWILIPTIIGMIALGLRGRLNFAGLANGRSLCIALLWVMFGLSYLFGPYVSVSGPYRFQDSGWAMETITKIVLLYFMACLCIDDWKKLRVLIWVAIGALLYLIYWANDQYLSGLVDGRLSGPAPPGEGGIFADENAFALVFVVLTPYIWYLSESVRKSHWKWLLRLAIPFAWHAVFLTASRGGLVGLAVITVVIALRSNSRLFGALLIPALLVAYSWQAGDLMKERAGTIDEFREEASAATRIEAWSAAVAMIKEYPLLGVGVGSFGPAFPSYSKYEPREAHNTFFQISAEVGLPAGILFTVVVVLSMAQLWRASKRLRKHDSDEAQLLGLVVQGTFAAMTGFSVCCLFLSLQLYEIFYFLCVVTNVVVLLSQRLEDGKTSARGTKDLGYGSLKGRNGEYGIPRGIATKSTIR